MSGPRELTAANRQRLLVLAPILFGPEARLVSRRASERGHRVSVSSRIQYKIELEVRKNGRLAIASIYTGSRQSSRAG